MTTTLASGISFADLDFQGLPRIIATGLLHGPDGIALVDPGPSSSLPVLERHLHGVGASLADVTALMVTHIHLDHSGAAGTLLARNPRIRVFVHERGAPHLVDPAKLLSSAGRLYGADMETLWGEVLPVPASAIVALSGGELISSGGRAWHVAYTPGHASHHVSYFSDETGIAFVGDTAGVQVVPGGFVLPPTPPPDIDVPAWMASLDTIERWHPRSLFLTHFGPTDTPSAHLAELRDHLQLSERLAREAVVRFDDEPAREAWFMDQLTHVVARRTSDTDVRAYQVAGRFDLNWRGMSRYVMKSVR
ncbi:MAG: MBL fold metallo-hydrolase [Vicinamibacterales bacterium]